MKIIQENEYLYIMENEVEPYLKVLHRCKRNLQ